MYEYTYRICRNICVAGEYCDTWIDPFFVCFPNLCESLNVKGQRRRMKKRRGTKFLFREDIGRKGVADEMGTWVKRGA